MVCLFYTSTVIACLCFFLTRFASQKALRCSLANACRHDKFCPFYKSVWMMRNIILFYNLATQVSCPIYDNRATYSFCYPLSTSLACCLPVISTFKHVHSLRWALHANHCSAAHSRICSKVGNHIPCYSVSLICAVPRLWNVLLARRVRRSTSTSSSSDWEI